MTPYHGLLASLLLCSFHSTGIAALTCDSSPSEVLALYERGSSEEVGKMQPGQWVGQKFGTSWDLEILHIVWSATGDWSRKSEPRSDYAVESSARSLGFGFDELNTALSNRCTAPQKNPCPEKGATPAECMTFFQARYEPLLARMDERLLEVQADPMTNHVAVISKRLEKDFGINRENAVLVGKYVVLDRARSGKLGLRKHAIEQANLRATRMSDSSAAVGLDPKRTESFRRALEVELNTYHAPRLRDDSPASPWRTAHRIDPKSGAYLVKVGLVDSEIEWIDSPYEMAVDVPAASATSVAQRMQVTRLIPWLVYELKGSQLTIRGGYLMREVGETDAIVPLRVVGKPQSTQVGKQAATEFEPRLVSAKDRQHEAKRRQYEADRAAWCEVFKSRIMATRPHQYDALTRECR